MDRLLVFVLSLVAGGLWLQGVVQARERAAPGERPEPRSEIRSVPAQETLSAALARLPPGASVDPATGLLIGVVPPDLPGCTPLTWERLREYAYQPGLEGLPESLRALDGQRVVMIGFLMPVFEWDDIREFHLVGNHWSCCYGVPPGLDSAVHVRLAPEQEGLPSTLKPIRVVGTLRIGEQKESGIVYAIYSIPDAEVVLLDY